MIVEFPSAFTPDGHRGGDSSDASAAMTGKGIGEWSAQPVLDRPHRRRHARVRKCYNPWVASVNSLQGHYSKENES